MGRRLQLSRQFPRTPLRVSEASLGETGRPRRAVEASHVPSNADGETGGEADDHSEDHVANVTMGCVNTGDLSLALQAGREQPAGWGSSPPNGAGSVTRMPFKLGGSTKTVPEQVEAQDHPAQIGPLVTEQPLWPRTMPEPHEVDRLFAQAFALVGEGIAGATHALLAGDRDAAKELVKRDEIIDKLIGQI